MAMTRTWVVYESMFGNTREVASAVAEGLGGAGPVELHEVSAAGPLPPDLDLLVVGAPTHAFGLSRPSSRDDASSKSGHPVESALMGVREWLESIEPGRTGTAFATFDTRVSHPRVPGSAAKKAAKRLRKLGLTQAVPPESFWVHGLEGPLDEGELERAGAWGRALTEAGAPERGVRRHQRP
ncbi:flavodoxin domain-containing protein [Pedococcus sp. KACC 23699]|uniref:Flavodoxin domain-containing protein n=1 Tax=Pedococcus sp. KACC 23699 TaxID=3149228 RepID=A0AAU7JUS1_9MICO